MCAVIYKSPQPLFCLPLLAEKWWSMQVVKRQKMTCRTMKWARCGGTYCSKCKTTKMTLWCLHFSFITFVSYVCLPLRGKRSILYEYFTDPEFIGQLIEFLSLEERKGKDSFNPRRFCLFKVQFKISYRFDKAFTKKWHSIPPITEAELNCTEWNFVSSDSWFSKRYLTSYWCWLTL